MSQELTFKVWISSMMENGNRTNRLGFTAFGHDDYGLKNEAVTYYAFSPEGCELEIGDVGILKTREKDRLENPPEVEELFAGDPLAAMFIEASSQVLRFHGIPCEQCPIKQMCNLNRRA